MAAASNKSRTPGSPVTVNTGCETKEKTQGDFSRFARFNDTALPNWATFFIRVINWECHKVEYSNFAKCLSLQYRSSSSKDTGLLICATAATDEWASRDGRSQKQFVQPVEKYDAPVINDGHAGFSWKFSQVQLDTKQVFIALGEVHVSQVGEGRWMAVSFCKYGVWIVAHVKHHVLSTGWFSEEQISKISREYLLSKL